MHDVIRDFLREELGAARLAGCTRYCWTPRPRPAHAPAAARPAVARLRRGGNCPRTARYLRDHLIEHLLAAGRAAQAEELAADLRWVGPRLERSGPAAPYADLALVGTPRAERLRRRARAGRSPAGAHRPAALADRHPVQPGQPRP